MKIRKSVAIIVVMIGLALTAVGLFLKVPGTHLTTYSGFDGDEAYDGKVYAAIDEYVGGDAYNYIIGASLVGGRISGTLTMKAVFIAVGALLFCMGLICSSMNNKAQESYQDNMQRQTVKMLTKLDALQIGENPDNTANM